MYREADLGEHAQQRLLGVIQTQTDIARLGPDLGAVMTLAAERAQALTSADGAVVELVEGDDMVYRAVSGMASHQLGLRLKRATSLSGLCATTGQLMRCGDSETDGRVDREACRRVGLRAMLVVPLRHDKNLVGALKVMSRRAEVFDEADMRILGLISELVAAAMFHATHNSTEELFYRATHDPLTGLANRALFFDRLRHDLADAQRSGEGLAILNFDMDDLKPINDRYGHRAGDAALCAFAGHLRDAARKHDTVARVGGDEFGVILTRVQDRDCASRQMRRIADSLVTRFRFEELELPLSGSVGLAYFPEDGGDLERLVETADQSMYAMKRSRQRSEM
ncbi:MAG: GGDEF domain-containing protein [Nevskiaceae bacterium]|nr:MAG: GGDEF domain-containing protein [Nevskiaceae bacterium]